MGVFLSLYHMNRLFLITIFLFSTLVFGQLASPVVGPEYDTQKKENFSGFIGENAIALFTADYVYHNRKKQELIIRQFHNGDLQLVNSTDIYSIIQDGYSNEPEEIFYQNGKFFLFSKLFSDRDKTELLAIEVFNESLERTYVNILDTLSQDEIQYIEESDSQNGFILAKHLKYTQLVEQQIDLIMINGEGKVKWQHSIKSPMALQNLRIENMAFNDKTPVYILCNYAYDLSTSTDVEQLVNNKYAIWAFDHEKGFLKEFEIRLKDKWVNGINIQFNKKNDMIISGYFNESKRPSIGGVFSLRIGPNLKIKNTSWSKFDNLVLEKFLKKDDRKRNPELEDYVMKGLNVLNDGSFFTLGEQYYKYIERSHDPRTNITTTTEHYNYNSIIVSYFDTLGNHQWTERVPKSQNSTNDYGYFSSFATLNSGKEIYLFFNDSRKNNESPPNGYFSYNNLFNNRRFQISYVHIGKNGIVTRGGLIEDSYDHLLRAKMSSQLSKDAIYMITETNRNSKIVRVSIK